MTYKDKLHGRFISLIASLARGRHLQPIQIICENQAIVRSRKLSTIVSEMEDKQKLDAVLLKEVLNLVNELRVENQGLDLQVKKAYWQGFETGSIRPGGNILMYYNEWLALLAHNKKHAKKGAQDG